ncbi:hypothetical protein CYQ88_01000 [Hydrogenovibrio sp. SC-1]|uniref:type II secretion system protein N n=1 Tax=Hydrogenovibrio sp. SC-1 TaxID=2065820 RepID=UPI000C7BD175|nr:type II secretion system protein N [Hydrogenovibrio sp. SC-1]PLA75574.1 hypothetical protein CYQ88_01000 [Hydrogenovibrio sp. SC-1]
MNWLKRYWGRMTLLSLVVLVSFIWHLPAAWVWQQSGIKQQLPPGLSLTIMKGAWWQGQTAIQWQGKTVSHIDWQWQPSAMLAGVLAVDLKLSAPKNQLTMQAAVTLDSVQLTSISGAVKMAKLADIPALALLDQAQGEVVLKALSVTVPWDSIQSQQPWPTAVSGQLALVDFSAMGMNLPLVEATPSLDESGLTLSVKGQGKGWNLAGQTWVSPKHIFAHDLTLMANSPQSMPDWVGLMMRQTQPTQAVLKARGRW